MEEQNNYCVYMHKNKINGKVYIGLTHLKPEKRWSNGNGYKISTYFGKAINKYGWDNFEHIVLYSELTKQEAMKLEIELIEKYNSTNDKFGYNIQAGGNLSNLGVKLKESTCNKMSESRIGEKNPFYNKHHDNETRQKISNSKKGKYTGENHPMYGKQHSDETKEKMSRAKMGKYVGGNNPYARKIYCVELDRIYESLSMARKDIGNGCCISRALKNHTLTAGVDKITGKGLHWLYYEEYISISKEQLDDIKNYVKEVDKFKVVCVNTKEVFLNGKYASNWCGLKSTANINACCNGLQKTAGKHPVTKEPLIWVKYLDYIKIHNESTLLLRGA